MKPDIKYRYALNIHDDTIVDVLDLSKADRHDYQCISCGNILRLVYGEDRQKHFRHKVSCECNVETYLHKLAKLTFKKTYEDCIQGGHAYNLEFDRPKHCTHCEGVKPCRVGSILYTYDLTQRFQAVKLETRDGEFIPDLLLYDPENEHEKLYIEIAVTHRISREKRESDNRIIELRIATEDDLQLIRDCLLSEHSKRVKLFNFDRKKFSEDFPQECSNIQKFAAVTLRDTYQNCLERSIPFTLELSRPKYCTHCPDREPCLVGSGYSRYDLTRSFRTIKLETPKNAPTPNIILLNRKMSVLTLN